MLILPIGTNRPPRDFPYVTVGLIVVNTLVLILEWIADDRTVLQWAFTPAHPQITAMFTSAFMHDGILHLLSNMIFLWVFGSVVEDALGPIVYTLFYIGGAVAAAMLHWVITRTMAPQEAMMPLVGASGAVAAVLAMFAVRFYRNTVRIFWLVGIWLWGEFDAPSLWTVGIWFGLELLFGFTSLHGGSGVAHWGHIGGFLFGLGMGFAMRSPQDAAREYLLDDARTSLAVMSPHAAIERLLPAVRAEPANEEMRVQLARAYELSGDEHASDEQCRFVLRLRLQQRRRAEVVELCRQVPRRSLLEGVDARTLYDIACCFEESFQYAEATRLLRAVWEQSPDAPEAELALLRQATLMKEKVHDPTADRLFDLFLQRYPYSQYRTFALAKRSGKG